MYHTFVYLQCLIALLTLKECKAHCWENLWCHSSD